MPVMAAARARAAPAPGARVPGRRLGRAAAGPPSGPAPGRRRRLLVLGICCSSIFLVGLDGTALAVALPSIGHDLGVPVSGLQWTVDVYLLVLASMQMAAGTAADRFGRRRVFRVGLGLFALGSLLCGLAPGLGWLLAARVVQACGGSMLNPAAMSVITATGGWAAATADRAAARSGRRPASTSLVPDPRGPAGPGPPGRAARRPPARPGLAAARVPRRADPSPPAHGGTQ